MHWHAGNDSGKEGLWPYLFTHVCQVHNALPTASLSPAMSPYEKMSGKRFDLNIFKNKVPLSDCWVNTANPGDKPINKLGSNNIKAVYLCYDSRRRGDFVYIPELKRITRDCAAVWCKAQQVCRAVEQDGPIASENAETQTWYPSHGCEP